MIALTGGNDGNNMVIPVNATQYQQYSQLRGKVALPQALLLPLYGSGKFKLRCSRTASLSSKCGKQIQSEASGSNCQCRSDGKEIIQAGITWQYIHFCLRRCCRTLQA